ncbi:hypothetical protein B0A49_10682 [Cryomyces minteri]|uniref:Uncharacterized protein n=1 Tax=Cryomyces minteri TaxID=331657 RepID=A0A4U0WSD5_9PEZI|nr:hypothetical protein B0A49_10682 [Cryomyces minteri]
MSTRIPFTRRGSGDNELHRRAELNDILSLIGPSHLLPREYERSDTDADIVQSLPFSHYHNAFAIIITRREDVFQQLRIQFPLELRNRVFFYKVSKRTERLFEDLDRYMSTTSEPYWPQVIEGLASRFESIDADFSHRMETQGDLSDIDSDQAARFLCNILETLVRKCAATPMGERLLDRLLTGGDTSEPPTELVHPFIMATYTQLPDHVQEDNCHRLVKIERALEEADSRHEYRRFWDFVEHLQEMVQELQASD